ncbi:Probable multidrug resistance ABC transporter ATP-binding/permease protein YheI [Acholeplasma oculi]|uniref:ABC type 1 transporter, permease protein n=1 Tax=Acholeplasma oculi TaxID=35623 RepID=A0A061AG71_9MOLU|nr:ABC transporter ATP-binding protein [Acholeplasma oculi]CDR30566.1 ABC type 1 transporter, permease protein [Acholeplasma oculi]SKC46989.1 ATP-binding cassette, subfamily B [Acholeplasma oculi]SUT89250.1 Probable multidrug resistance ABC transporter ATP-binding/permease protein YheI [Acholeplasma oculi]
MILLKHFRHYYLKYGFQFLLGIVILVLIDYFQLEIPRIFNVIITQVEDNELTAITQLYEPLLYIISIVAFMTIGRYLWRFLLFGNGRKIETDIRFEMFKHATKLSQNFYSKEKIGGLMSYFINDLNAIRELYGFGLLMLIDGLVLGGMVLFRMFNLNWEMTLYAFIPLLLMGILVFFLELKMEHKFKVRQESFEKMSDFTQESFTGIQVIKAYVRELKEAITFDKKSKEVYNKSMAHMRYAVFVNIIIDVMITLVILSVLVYGSLLIARGNLNSGTLTEYISYFFTLLWPIFALSWFMNINGQAQASAKRIYKFLESDVDVKDIDNPIKDVTIDGSITVKNLTFTYDGDKNPVLKNMNFDIKAGEMVGILGKTGSGKSTLVELLLHVYNTDKNMIYYGSYDINDLEIKTLRDHIGYVPQDNFLYSDTIKNNIGFSFKEPISDEWLHEVAKLSDVHQNVLEFKEQYETILGERGTTVSGGQKQRISIARALAKDPTILILDDSVSAVDTKTEEAIISNLRKIRKGKTTIMIAHRISTVKKLDKIILIEKGQIIGVGSHKELLKTNDAYKHMVKLQELEALVGEGEHHA